MSPGCGGGDHYCYTKLLQCWPGVQRSHRRVHLLLSCQSLSREWDDNESCDIVLTNVFMTIYRVLECL